MLEEPSSRGESQGGLRFENLTRSYHYAGRGCQTPWSCVQWGRVAQCSGAVGRAQRNTASTDISMWYEIEERDGNRKTHPKQHDEHHEPNHKYPLYGMNRSISSQLVNLARPTFSSSAPSPGAHAAGDTQKRAGGTRHGARGLVGQW
jgi:hypothetical protein